MRARTLVIVSALLSFPASAAASPCSQQHLLRLAELEQSGQLRDQEGLALAVSFETCLMGEPQGDLDLRSLNPSEMAHALKLADALRYQRQYAEALRWTTALLERPDVVVAEQGWTREDPEARPSGSGLRLLAAQAYLLRAQVRTARAPGLSYEEASAETSLAEADLDRSLDLFAPTRRAHPGYLRARYWQGHDWTTDQQRKKQGWELLHEVATGEAVGQDFSRAVPAWAAVPVAEALMALGGSTETPAEALNACGATGYDESLKCYARASELLEGAAEPDVLARANRWLHTAQIDRRSVDLDGFTEGLAFWAAELGDTLSVPRRLVDPATWNRQALSGARVARAALLSPDEKYWRQVATVLSTELDLSPVADRAGIAYEVVSWLQAQPAGDWDTHGQIGDPGQSASVGALRAQGYVLDPMVEYARQTHLALAGVVLAQEGHTERDRAFGREVTSAALAAVPRYDDEDFRHEFEAGKSRHDPANVLLIQWARCFEAAWALGEHPSTLRQDALRSRLANELALMDVILKTDDAREPYLQTRLWFSTITEGSLGPPSIDPS